MAVKTRRPRAALPDDPLWYKDAVIYELHVRAFHDSDGDGIGDFAGLTGKLDYLQELGVNALWLLPFYPSPLRDDGYDIADYCNIHPNYGTLRDFENFLAEAHRRGLRVITELVINHTSDQHPWFQRARRAKPGSPERDFYVWSDSPERYPDARIIFKDFEQSNWRHDTVAKAYYWHRFYSHQPDLNFDNPAVRKAVFGVMDFWLSRGVDGLRLDAVPYLYEREGTDCENLPETHVFLKDLRRRIDRNYRDRMLLAEANQWPEDAAAYFGDGDECHLNFHFPLMPRMFMAIQKEDRFPVIDILQQTPKIADNAQWALFLRNHDELTLEMVTDEERDYMYRVYATERQARINLGIRRRLAPLLGNGRRRIELMNALLLSLPGTPVIYYGDEIGMGDNIYLGDRNGVRTPMQWSADRNAGFSRANPQGLFLPAIIDSEYHYQTLNVESQINNPHSLLWFMKRLIAMRRRFRAFGRGSIEFLLPDNRKILAYVRRHEDEAVLVVANLSRFAQHVSLDLAAFQGNLPVEVFGRSEFPPITDQPYPLAMSAHGFYWFALQPPRAGEVAGEVAHPALTLRGSWEDLLTDANRERLEAILPRFIRGRRWFGGKARRIDAAEVTDALVVQFGERPAYLALVSVSYDEGEAETYQIPLGFATGAWAEEIARDMPQAVIARLSLQGKSGVEEGLLYDAACAPDFSSVLLRMIERRRTLHGWLGTAAGERTEAYRRILKKTDEPPKPKIGRAEQSNTSVLFGDRFIFKLFRRLEEGINPELEIGLFLTERARFPHVPPVAGHISYRRGRGQAMTLGFLQGFVPNEGDAWSFTLDELERFFDRAASRLATVKDPPVPAGSLAAIGSQPLPQLAQDAIGGYVEWARLLGQRTAEMHIALGTPMGDDDFEPERFTPFYRRSMFQSLRNLTRDVLQLLRSRSGHLSEQAREEAGEIQGMEKEITAWFRQTLEAPLGASRIRIHGDYHLGQVLYTGRDFVIIDFEGEPARPLGERRLKRSPLRDVAGMLRSFHYAAYAALHGGVERRGASEEQAALLERWAGFWHRYIAAVYVKSYLDVAGPAPFLAGMSPEHCTALLNIYRLEKAIYELGYELNNRPEWVRIPLAGIRQIWDELR